MARENYEVKKRLVDEFRGTLPRVSQGRLAKLLAYYKDLSMLEVSREAEILAKVTTEKTSEKTLVDFIQLQGYLREIIESNSTKQLYGYRIGQTVYLDRKPLEIAEFIPEIGAFLWVGFGSSSLNRPCLLELVTTKPRSNVGGIRFGKKDASFADDLHVSDITSSVGSIIRQYASGKFNFDPFYQRGLVWSIEQKQDFVTAMVHKEVEFKPSFIMLPYKVEKEKGYLYEVLDGKQRFDAILSYLKGEFPVDGLYWQDLNTYEVDFFENLTAVYTQYKYFTDLGWVELPDNYKVELFLQVNEYGTRVSEEHLTLVKEQFAH